jgi:hypothetical protein
MNILKDFISEEELDQKIWRYMDLGKLESILKTNSLYFASAEQFSANDLHEGAITENEYFRRKTWAEKTFPDPAQVESDLKSTHDAFKPLRKYTKISCWHFNSIENMAMWLNYQGEKKGIAIQTTPHKLASALGPYRIEPGYGEEDMTLAKVKYIDYEKDAMVLRYGFLTPFLYKRINYAYEEEVRVLISLRLASEFGVNVPEKGISVPFNLKLGIEKLILAPNADAEYLDAVVNLMKTYNVEIAYEKSVMAKLPKY